jgi:hypothetical protein
VAVRSVAQPPAKPFEGADPRCRVDGDLAARSDPQEGVARADADLEVALETAVVDEGLYDVGPVHGVRLRERGREVSIESPWVGRRRAVSAWRPVHPNPSATLKKGP